MLAIEVPCPCFKGRRAKPSAAKRRTPVGVPGDEADVDLVARVFASHSELDVAFIRLNRPSARIVSFVSRVSSSPAKLEHMKTVRKTTETRQRVAPIALSVNIDLDPLVAVVRRHVKLTPQATRLIRGEFAQLFQTPTISGSARRKANTQQQPAADHVLTTQEAADLVGVSRPYIVARIEAGDIPLHQQVGNQRRVLRSAVLAWHRQEQARRRKALSQLGADLDSEILAG